jgi:hypothetical protein
MLYSEIIPICSESHTKHINTLFGRKVEFMSVKLGRTYSDHRALKIELLWERVVLSTLFFKQRITNVVPGIAVNVLRKETVTKIMGLVLKIR